MANIAQILLLIPGLWIFNDGLGQANAQAAPPVAQRPQGTTYIAVFKPNSDKEPVKRQITALGGQITFDLPLINAISFWLPAATAPAILTAVKMDPAISLVEQDQVFNISANAGNNAAGISAPIAAGLQHPTSLVGGVIPGSYIIVFKAGADKESIKRLIVAQGGRVVHELTLINAISVKLPPATADAFIRTLSVNPAINYIEQDHALNVDNGFVNTNLGGLAGVANATPKPFLGATPGPVPVPAPAPAPAGTPSPAVMVNPTVPIQGAALPHLGPYIPNRFIVAFKQGTNRQPLQAWIIQNGGKITADLPIVNGIGVEFPAANSATMTNYLKVDSRVAYIEQERVIVPGIPRGA